MTTVTVSVFNFPTVGPVGSSDIDATWAAFGSQNQHTGSLSVGSVPGHAGFYVGLRRSGDIDPSAIPTGINVALFAIRAFITWSQNIPSATGQIRWGGILIALKSRIPDAAVDSGTNVVADMATLGMSLPIAAADFFAPGGGLEEWGWDFATNTGAGTAVDFDVTDFHLEIDWDYIAPNPTFLSPNTGTAAGGDAVSVFGDHFATDAVVRFDGVDATSIVWVNSGQIDCVTPAGTGTVDVEVENVAEGKIGTLTDGFIYSGFLTGIVVDGGAPQVVLGPPPTTKTTTAVVTPGTTPIASYLWEQLTGPATPSIVDPASENTDIIFSVYAPGTYTFQLTASSGDVIPFVGTGIAVFILRPTVAPRVSNSSQQVFWSDGVHLAPTIVDDGWGG